MPHLPRFPLALLAVVSLATVPSGIASAGWLSDLFEPVAYEELAAPPEAAEDVPIPVPEGSSLGFGPGDSVLMNAPLAVEETWMPPLGGPGAEQLPGDFVMEDPSAPYSAASPFWPAKTASARACCDRPSILYWNHPLLASTICRCDCGQTTDLVLSVPNGCCPVDVTVCVPSCCSDAPAYEVDRDWLGRVTHTYCWPCGYQIEIVQLHIGSWMVHTYNR